MVGQQMSPAPAGQVATPELARALRDLLGERLTAVIAGVTDAGALRAWTRGAAPPLEAERRLRHAYEIAQLLLQHEEPESVRAWFMGSEPRLDDRSPALVLGEDPAAVARAARAFLANG
ncbi:MAG: XRE family transcriptional regulator [Chloroflexota bacterium]